MAAPDQPSHVHPAGTSGAATQPGSVASAGLPAAMPARGEEAVGLWPIVALAFAALVLAVLWKKNGGLRFFPRRPPAAMAPPAGAPPVLGPTPRDLPDRGA